MSQLAIVSLVAALVVVVSAIPFHSGVLHEIEKINSMQNSWKAGVNDHISSLSIPDFLGLLGFLRSPNFIRRKEVKAADNIPKTFDARTQWPQCDSISSIKDQGKCGSCWAVAAVSAASDRLCIGSNFQVKVNLSAENLMDCCSDCAPNGGCEGGYIDEAWKYIQSTGVVTGGDYGSDEGCQPYEVPPSPSSAEESHSCQTQCTTTNETRSYSDDGHQSDSFYHLPRDARKIQTDIMKNGPVEAGFTVYSDFKHYKSGVYRRSFSATPLGGHAVRLLGWGTENGTPFWLAANSWNTTWGDNGTFKIKRGSNECGIESDVFAVSSAYFVSSNVAVIQKEIILHGPVVAGFDIYEDFYSYKTGVYQSQTNIPLHCHEGKIIGWGVEEENPYWLIENSWNSDWGDKGLFKILRGNNTCGIESFVTAGIPIV